MSLIKERVLMIPEQKGMTKQEFCKLIGMSYGNFTGKSKSTPINSNAIGNISIKFPDVNLEWLIKGEGEMFKSNIDHSKTEAIKVYDTPVEVDQDSQLISLYSVKSTENFANLFKDPKSQNLLGTIKIPNLLSCDGAVYFIGNGMSPVLKSGDIVIYKQIHHFLKDIFWGEMYLIVANISGEEYVDVRYIHKSTTDGYIKLLSYNNANEAKDISLNDVVVLAIIKASVTINLMY